jgi:hypothetical protein
MNDKVPTASDSCDRRVTDVRQIEQGSPTFLNQDDRDEVRLKGIDFQ